MFQEIRVRADTKYKEAVMKKEGCLVLFISLCIALLTGLKAAAMDMKGKIGLNINLPGVGVKYGVSSTLATELKYQMGSDITIMGLRVYKYMGAGSMLPLFWGVEADTVNFKSSASKGTGLAYGVFLGGESFITNSLGILLDIGAMNITLTDDATKESVAGIEPVVNVGINLYFGGGK